MAAEQPSPNARAHPYRGLSVQHVDRSPEPDFVMEYLLGREVYRRTDYVGLVHREDGEHGPEAALAAVTRAEAGPDDLFAPVTEVEVWSGPDRTMLVEEETADVGNATALAEAALARARPGVSGFLVKGKFEHINFIWEPSPLRIHVTEVTPPDPPKLLEQARQAVAYDEDLPPIELVLEEVTFSELAGRAPAPSSPDPSYLVPCRGAGLELPGELSYLDTRPARRGDWVMIGCERSMQLHRHFYGDDPPQVDICPRRRVDEAEPEGRWLVKCCMLERGTEFEPGRAVVPWGANLDEVRRALRWLAGVPALSG